MLAQVKKNTEYVFRKVIKVDNELVICPLNPIYPNFKIDKNVIIFGVLTEVRKFF